MKAKNMGKGGGGGRRGGGGGRRGGGGREDKEKGAKGDETTAFKDSVVIDGSYGEGGGQVVRNAISLSVLLGKAVVINNIRAKRPKPGLAAQHLTGIQLVARMCNAKLRGALIGSTSVAFQPSSSLNGVYEGDTGTAGSVGLLLQISFPCMIFGPGPYEVTYKGGTDAIKAPQLDYFMKVFKPYINKFGVDFEINLVRRGFYPKGGGVVTVKVNPVPSLKPIVIEERGDIIKIEINAFSSGVIPISVPQRMCSSALKVLEESLRNVEMKVNPFLESREKAFGDGTAILICAYTSNGNILAGSAVGERGKSSEDVGMEAANHLLKDIATGGCVDEYMQDQLILFMALAEGQSKIKVGPLSEHTLTSIHINELLTGAKFDILKTDLPGENSYWIHSTGINYINPFLTAPIITPSGD